MHWVSILLIRNLALKHRFTALVSPLPQLKYICAVFACTAVAETKNNEMKKYLMLVALVMGMIGVNAQSGSIGSNDPNAKKVLDGVSAKFKTFKGVQANFTLQVEAYNESSV